MSQLGLRPSRALVSARRRRLPPVDNALVLLAGALIIWGPPAIRRATADRPLSAALDSPLSLDPAALLQVASWLLAAVLAGFWLVRHLGRGTLPLDSLLSERPVRWYLLFGLMAVASAAYSASPLYTLYFALRIFVGMAVLALIAWHGGPDGARRLLSLAFLVFGLQTVAISVLFLIDPTLVGGIDGGVRFRLTGGVLSDYGASALIVGLYFLTLLLFGSTRRQRIVGTAGYIASWGLIVASATRSTMASGLLFLVIMALAHPRLRNKVALLGLIAVVALLGLVPAFGQSVFGVLTRQGEGLEDLSGRTVAFTYLLDQWQSSPVVGYGFGAGTRAALIPFVEQTGLGIGAGHDMLSTVLVDLGAVGALILLIALISAWRGMLLLYRSVPLSSPSRILLHQLICLLAWITLSGLVDPGIAGGSVRFEVVLVTMWALRTFEPDRSSSARLNV
ncbi:MAG: O-antigen ligase family protein [Egibacteraceae bacterium]